MPDWLKKDISDGKIWLTVNSNGLWIPKFNQNSSTFFVDVDCFLAKDEFGKFLVLTQDDLDEDYELMEYPDIP